MAQTAKIVRKYIKKKEGEENKSLYKKMFQRIKTLSHMERGAQLKEMKEFLANKFI